MIRRLIILLLIVGCEEVLEPEDCAGVAGGTAVVDDCGICDGDNDNCITDIDGNWYKTVAIGSQLWMAENLKVIHYNNGDEIPTGLSTGTDGEWATTTEGAYAIYPSDEDETSQLTCGDDCTDMYGNLYNWFAVDDDRGLCPSGWHVPSDDEYTILAVYLGGAEVAGGKMKKSGNEHWKYKSDKISEEATNESGFTGLPAGNRSYLSYGWMGKFGDFWSSSEYEYSSELAWRRSLKYSTSDFQRSNNQIKNYGYSIRCVKD